MISRIEGELVSADLDRVEVRTVSGLVYRVHVPTNVLDRLPGLGQRVELLTHYLFRDEVHWLYGFIEERERELFQRLVTVPRVGPVLARNMMGAHQAGRLARAIAEGDVHLLTRVKGMGKKTAERVVLELAGKVGDLDAGDSPGGGKERRRRTQEAVEGLTRLGYSFADADRAVRAAIKEGGDKSTEELVREVLAGRRSAGGS